MSRPRKKLIVQMHSGIVSFSQSPPAIPLFTAGWYVFSVVYNLSTKAVLSHYDNCVVVSTLQLAACLLLLQRPTNMQITPYTLCAAVVVAAGQYFGNLFGIIATREMSVSLVSIIKSAEPLVALCFCWCAFRRTEKLTKWLAIVPTIIGIALCNRSDLTFTNIGLMMCMLSNLAHVVKGVYSKNVFVDVCGLGGPELMFVSTLGSVILSLPLSLQSAASIPALFADINVSCYFLVSAAAYYLNSYCAFQVMSRLQPVAYSWANVYKRLFVIIIAIWMEKSFNMSTAVGIGLTFAGLITYML